jgi:hypothetical protein
MVNIDLLNWAEKGHPPQWLWARAIILALKDGASQLCYDPAAGDKALTYRINENTYTMISPPVSLANELIAEIRGVAFARVSFFKYITGLWQKAALSDEFGKFSLTLDDKTINITVHSPSSKSMIILNFTPDKHVADSAQLLLERIRNLSYGQTTSDRNG